MCLAVPMKILSIEGKLAEVNRRGVSQTISLMLLKEAKVGDYVIVHAGYAIETLKMEEAHQRLDLFKELDPNW